MLPRAIVLGTVLLLLGLSTCPAQEFSARAPARAMTNQDVIDMVGLGLSEGVIVDKVRIAQATDFDTSVTGLRVLKAAKVGDEVIRAMVNAHPVGASSRNSATPIATNGAVPEEIGVYCVHHGQLEQMDPEIVGWKTGGVLKEIVTLGFDRGHVNGKVMKPKGPVRLSNPLEFVVKTPEGTSATEYQLLQLYKKGNRREFRAVTGGILHVSAGAERTALTFNPEKIAARTWRIKLQGLPSGEYGFLPPGYTSSSIGSSGKMYTFSIVEDEYPRGADLPRDSVLPAIVPSSEAEGTAHGGASIGAWSDQNPTVRHDGVVLSHVESGSPADQVGIKPGDVILAINGHFLYTVAELADELSRIPPGTRIPVRYQRRSTIYDTYLVVSDAKVDRAGLPDHRL